MLLVLRLPSLSQSEWINFKVKLLLFTDIFVWDCLLFSYLTGSWSSKLAKVAKSAKLFKQENGCRRLVQLNQDCRNLH